MIKMMAMIKSRRNRYCKNREASPVPGISLVARSSEMKVNPIVWAAKTGKEHSDKKGRSLRMPLSSSEEKTLKAAIVPGKARKRWAYPQAMGFSCVRIHRTSARMKRR